MIHLDTNYLIGLLVRNSPSAIDVDKWLAAGESLAVSALAWSEFLNGPVTAVEVSRVELVIQSRSFLSDNLKLWSPQTFSTRRGDDAVRDSIASLRRRRSWRKPKSRR